MSEIDPKTRIQKYPISSNAYKAFSANVSDFYRNFTIENQKIEFSYLFKTLSYAKTL